MKKSENESTLMLKLVSLLLALLIWFRISGTVMKQEQIKTQTFTNILLEFTDTTESIEPKSDVTYFVVNVSGTDKDLKALEQVGFNVELSMGSLGPGNYTFPLTSENIQFPPELTSLNFERIIPNFLEVSFIEQVRKQVALEVYTDGEVAEGYEVVNVILNPEKVEIKGPPREIKDLQYLFGKNIDIQGLKENKSGLITLEPDQMPEDTVIYGITNLRYTVVVREKRETVKPDVVYPISIGDPLWKVDVEGVSLSMEGPISSTRWVDPAWIVATVSLPAPEEAAVETPEAAPAQAVETPPDATQTVPEVVIVPITASYLVPDEVKAATPDWLAKLNRLTLQWTPAEVEIRKAKEGEDK